MGHPFDPLWHPGGSVLRSGRVGSIVEVTRFEVPSFKPELKDAAEWFEISKMTWMNV
jgi:hypothetical protein